MPGAICLGSPFDAANRLAQGGTSSKYPSVDAAKCPLVKQKIDRLECGRKQHRHRQQTCIQQNAAHDRAKCARDLHRDGVEARRQAAPRRTDKVARALGTSIVGCTPALRDRKVAQLASVIAQINGGAGPDLLGVCEVENRFVLDLLAAVPAGKLAIADLDVTTADEVSELERAGVVAREEAPPPVATTLYSLTDRGRELATVVRELGRWGVDEYLQTKQVYINLDEQPVGWF